MAKLIKCSDCRKKVSRSAASCPHCGAPLPVAEVQEKVQVQKTYLWTILRVVFILIFVVIGMAHFGSNPVFAISSFIVAVLTAKSARLFISKLLPRPGLASAILVVSVGVWFLGAMQVSKKISEENAREFFQNKSEIIAEIRSNIDDGAYDVAINTLDRYRAADDPQLKSLRDEAIEQQKAVRREEAEKRAAARAANAKAEEERKAAAVAESAPKSNKERFLADPARAFAWMEKDKAAIKATFKDPGSAQFDGVFISFYEDSPATCGKVNARNSFGAYVGFTEFVSAHSAGMSIVRGDGQMTDSEFVKSWNTVCKDPISL